MHRRSLLAASLGALFVPPFGLPSVFAQHSSRKFQYIDIHTLLGAFGRDHRLTDVAGEVISRVFQA